MNKLPKTKLGQWAIGLQTLFLIVITSSVILVKVLNVLNFDDRWFNKQNL